MPRYRSATWLLLLITLTACAPNPCDVPPYAFSVSISFFDAHMVPFEAVVTAESGQWTVLFEQPEDPFAEAEAFQVEWGGAEPEGSVGEFLPAEGVPLTPVELIAVQNDAGCPATQHGTATFVHPLGPQHP